MGTLRFDDAPLPRPTRPWLDDLSILRPFDFVPAGDIAGFASTPTFERWSLGSSDPDPAKCLQWVEVETRGRMLLICDRVILVRVSWDDLSHSGYIEGREVTIDGRRFVCRVLSGGETFAVAQDGFSGGQPDNEWDVIVGRTIDGLPTPATRTKADSLDAEALNDPHNQVWNWFGALSWTREPVRDRENGRVCRGFHSAGYFYVNTQSHRHEDIGWRPVLEAL